MTTTGAGMRLAAACGVLYPVLLIVGDDVIARGDAIAADAGSPEEVLSAIADKGATFLMGRSIGMLSAVCLFVFAVYVAARLRTLRREGSPLPLFAVGGGAIAATLQLGSAIVPIAVVRNSGAGLNPELAVILMDIGTLGFLVAMLPLALLIGSVAAAGVGGQLVGRAVAWAAAVLSAGLVVGFALFVAGVPLGFLPMPLSWLWFVAAGVSCIRREHNHRTTTADAIPPRAATR